MITSKAIPFIWGLLIVGSLIFPTQLFGDEPGITEDEPFILLPDGWKLLLTSVELIPYHVQEKRYWNSWDRWDRARGRPVEFRPDYSGKGKGERLMETLRVTFRKIPGEGERNEKARYQFLMSAKGEPPVGIPNDYSAYDLEDNLGIDGVHFNVWPRRARELELILIYHSPNHGILEIGRIAFPNPHPYDGPKADPIPFPITVQSGELELVIKDLVVGVDRNEKTNINQSTKMFQETFYKSSDKDKPYLLMIYQILFKGAPSRSWEITDLWFTDSTGNVSSPEHSSGGNNNTYRFNSLLDSRDPTWDFHLTMEQQSGFAVEDTIEFTSIPVPPVGMEWEYHIKKTIHGLGVILETFNRKKENQPLSVWSSPNLSSITIRFRGAKPGQKVIFLGAQSQEFGDQLILGSSYEDSALPGLGFYFRRIPENLKELDFSLAVSESRKIQFRGTTRPLKMGEEIMLEHLGILPELILHKH